MRHRLYCHLIWRTRDNAPLIDAPVARFLCRFFRAIAREERARVLEIGLVADHAHLLVRLHPETRLSRLVQRLKGSSAAVCRKERHSPAGRALRWSKGYTVQSVSPQALGAVRRYLRQQATHHPSAAIAGWEDDRPAFDGGGMDEWRGPNRVVARSLSPSQPTSVQDAE